jgi:integrase
LPVGSIDTALVLKVLEPIWLKTPETASRVRQRIESVLDYAKAIDCRQGENPAIWKGRLKDLLPKQPSKAKRVRHHPALPHANMPAFMAELRRNTLIAARALEFTILTAGRTSEVIGATWGEIDFKARIWTVPAERMKAGVEHKVPLSDRVLEILAGLPREAGNPHVFIGGKLGQPLYKMGMLHLIKNLRPGFVPHGFRSTFLDWATERTNYPKFVAEKALAHAIDNKVEEAYRRGDLLDKRRPLMATWAKFCASPASKAVGGNVVPMRGKAS